jgi:hypothetical protein
MLIASAQPLKSNVIFLLHDALSRSIFLLHRKAFCEQTDLNQIQDLAKTPGGNAKYNNIKRLNKNIHVFTLKILNKLGDEVTQKLVSCNHRRAP